ncbi:uncharacterized protein LOC142985955 [Anticarsia gemmatalis]|uniref:uncharacterized protein LOC142985955 n=1 Tax=Anticarsia gemmatalis TaxID=129554 RepID=UPI003F768CB8
MSDSSDSAKSCATAASTRSKKRVSTAASSDICRVAVRIPPFWPDDPEIWFAQVEAQFANANVTSDATKFNYVIGNLEYQYSKQVRDILIAPPAENKYEKLKQELVKRLSASKEKRVQQLLMHEELGDRKPSQFLRHLQGLAGPSVPEEFLRTIWSSRLPSNVQTLLASQPNANLEAVADLADRVQDIVSPSQVAAASSPSSGRTMQDMAGEIAELRKAVKDLTTQMRQRSRSPSRSRARRRSRSGSRRSDSSHRKHPLCWYHYKFGANANSCVKPCDYRPSGNSQGSR